MSSATVTDLGKYRAACQPPVVDAFAWINAMQSIAETNCVALIQMSFMMPRAVLRHLAGV